MYDKSTSTECPHVWKLFIIFLKTINKGSTLVMRLAMIVCFLNEVHKPVGNGVFVLQHCLNLLDVGAKESLSDVISKVLRKVANQPEGKDEDLDDTLIT
ncbi:hypothetical protein PR048_026533 [Dryococelus australis]|uniref:Uncharacterized protein n=1 Tax=Dryococelus australis TaxID=614101 RepID=A0ABQ9GLM9_9NEOP|nr:hypothetical protein PR048_026533 [Dryococelus australis]